jgi:hypothetical protein
MVPTQLNSRHNLILCAYAGPRVMQVALATVGRLLQSLPVLRECPQLLQRVAVLMEPQVAAEGRRTRQVLFAGGRRVLTPQWVFCGRRWVMGRGAATLILMLVWHGQGRGYGEHTSCSGTLCGQTDASDVTSLFLVLAQRCCEAAGLKCLGCTACMPCRSSGGNTRQYRQPHVHPDAWLC